MIITYHKTNGLNDAIEIEAQGERGAGGAFTTYQLNLKPDGVSKLQLLVMFQNGPIYGPQDFNGLTNEALMAVLIHRMEGFVGGPFQHPKNHEALLHLKLALDALQARTSERQLRKVEGKLIQ